jgi:hypothetical protein
MILGRAGRDCKYRHALPPGFVLKSEKKAAEEAAKKEVISLEEFLETEVNPTNAVISFVSDAVLIALYLLILLASQT